MTGLGNLPSSLSPPSLLFAPQTVGTTSAPQIITVWNFENSSMTVVGWTASGDYAVSPGGTQPCSVGGLVAAKNHPFCNLQVTFTPSMQTKVPGAITVSTGWSSSPQAVAVTGTGQ
jgi:hypothetical protein